MNVILVLFDFDGAFWQDAKIRPGGILQTGGKVFSGQRPPGVGITFQNVGNLRGRRSLLQLVSVLVDQVPPSLDGIVNGKM